MRLGNMWLPTAKLVEGVVTMLASRFNTSHRCLHRSFDPSHSLNPPAQRAAQIRSNSRGFSHGAAYACTHLRTGQVSEQACRRGWGEFRTVSVAMAKAVGLLAGSGPLQIAPGHWPLLSHP
jgi:hypothetical protein